jgi:hypothetical protein
VAPGCIGTIGRETGATCFVVFDHDALVRRGRRATERAELLRERTGLEPDSCAVCSAAN